MKKTVEQWEKYFDTLIMDADGFPENTNRKTTLFTKSEFLHNVQSSTVIFSEILKQALNG